MGKLVSTLVTFSVFIGIILLVVTVDRTDYVCPGSGCGKGVARPVQEKSRARIMAEFKATNQLKGKELKKKQDTRKEHEDILTNNIYSLLGMHFSDFEETEESSNSSDLQTNNSTTTISEEDPKITTTRPATQTTTRTTTQTTIQPTTIAQPPNTDLTQFTGNWSLTDNDAENFEEYLTAVGLNYFKRPIAISATRFLSFEIVQGSKFSVVSWSTNPLIPTTKYTVTLGKPWADKTSDGVEANCRFEFHSSFDGGFLVKTESRIGTEMVSFQRWSVVDGGLEIRLSMKQDEQKFSCLQKYARI